MQTNSALLSEPLSELSNCLQRLARERSSAIPLSTYRLQFNNTFRFQDATRLVPYLSKLGISHCYSSPILKARAGSQHGYDIVDHSQLNPEIGTEEDFRQFVAELKKHGMGLVVDTVPNHMGVGHGSNPWWQDVLQNGRTSAYADFFDIDWEPLKPELCNKVLNPVLGKPYGEDLEEGNIQVSFEADRFLVRYGDKTLPIDPQTIPLIFAPSENESLHPYELSAHSREFNSLLNALAKLPLNSATDPAEVLRRQREIPELTKRWQELARDSAFVREKIEQALRRMNGTPGDVHSFDGLHQLLEAQAYRLAFWRVSGEEINYRRFFDINDLIGLRMENARVFAETHKLLRKFLGEGLIAGLRIDHPDGLLDPTQYFMRLQRLYAACKCLGPRAELPVAADGIELEIHSQFAQHKEANEQPLLYLLIEKILEPGEHLPSYWPVDGSVGYDFTNVVNGILIDQRHERLFTNLYHRVIDGTVRVDRLIYESKKLIMQRALASEVSVLSHLLDTISNQNRRARDFTRKVLRDAIRETIACFPVYRTYIDEHGHVSEQDRHYIDAAIELAKRRNRYLAPAVLDFLRSILLLEGAEDDASIYGYRRQLYFTLKFQQLTGPVMAKGMEDTACYVYNRFISVNEVGGWPGSFGISLDQFHAANEVRAQRWPSSMLATSSHDTKRSEDVRARLDVLSEMPNTWGALVMKWRRINRRYKTELPDGRTVPDNNEEYLLYQTIVGAWPVHMHGEEQRREFITRIQRYMEKAVHEAKVNVSWLNPNPDYVTAINDFVEKILTPTRNGKPNLFWESLQKFLSPTIFFGSLNSLTQTLLKIACPGVPDIYQGQELLDFSLVDPDNRRPVDFEHNQRALDELELHGNMSDRVKLCEDLLNNYRDGRLKMWVTARALNLRRSHRQLFESGSYVPLPAICGKEEHLVSFARTHQGEAAIVAAPRLSYTLMRGREEPPLNGVWGDTEIPLPPEASNRQLRNVFTDEVLTVGKTLLCREAFASFPAALLVTV